MRQQLQSPIRVDGAFQRLADLMASEVGGEIRVGTRADTHLSKNGHAWTMHRAGMRAVHHLRVVAPHELVIDLGDDRGGKPTPWARVVDESHAVAIALNRMAIPYWMALSGGKGVHFHIFGEPGSNPAGEVEHQRVEHAVVEDPNIDKQAVVNDAPPCIARIFRALAAGKGVPHYGRLAIASYMHHAGVPQRDIENLFARTPNYNARRTQQSVESIVNNHYLPPSCQRMAQEGICHSYLKVSRCHRVSNPVSFLRKSTNAGISGFEAKPVETGPRDWRHAAGGTILEVANAILARITGNPLDEIEGIDADYRLLAPSKNSRLVREFGRRKSVTAKVRKILWHVGPGPFPTLPSEKKDAYAMAEARKRVYPTSVPHSPLHLLDRGDSQCPRSSACIFGHPNYNGHDKTCPLRGV